MVHCRPLTETTDPAAITTATLDVRVGPAGDGGDPYLLVPFEVPPGGRAVRLTVAFPTSAHTARAPEGAVVDLGLFGPSGPGEGDAFRGYSGSERGVVVVGERSATPGYRPGPIEPGVWRILLGSYRVPPGGVPVTLTLEALAGEPPVPGGVSSRPAGPRPTTAGPDRRVPGATPMRWIPVDLHAHTLHSDGAETPAELAARARARGLEALFVTDHNTDAHLPDLPGASLPVLLPGEEVTTYGGHLNALGITSWVDFRCHAPDGVASAVAEVHRQGAIASVNHPASPGDPWRHGAALDIDAVEVWNGPWSAEDDAALAWWEGLLSDGRRVTAVGGSDTHGPAPGEQPVGTPTTWVRASAPTLRDILGAVRRGNVVVTRDPATPPPELWVETPDGRASVGETISAARPPATSAAPLARWLLPDAFGVGEDAGLRTRLIADGTAVHEAEARDARSGAWPCPPTAGRLRLEVRDAGGALIAATNHVHISRSVR